MLYQVAVLQFEVKRYTECRANTDIIIKDPKANDLKLSFADKDKKQQEVPLNAAACNVRGMVEKMDGNKDEAKKYFQKSLDIMPDFFLAKQNMEDIDKPISEPTGKAK